jgi:hypothetical protein
MKTQKMGKSKGQRFVHAKQAQREGSGRAVPILKLGARQGVWSTPRTVIFTPGTVGTGAGMGHRDQSGRVRSSLALTSVRRLTFQDELDY